ncbi:2-dehydropantoate 2-reductase [Marinomonas mediterranea]|jgi:2-dehydropantoate 2-reductase|uniref:2-dehydropantoate 2-reductase n=1 Tax=Marinomonas mediterranea (strain ATCC 700492 / JCM 21426 / NBRC 103028 / MMB-1) TaxID=717774 RepID=F2JV80_MARM1|nr:2-dehydropantoate 2-reductase [Marinomonas mediterranea]ADZ92838.1 2-dehydropantoate 2-reductase [Marinomonas mediterranea MMB-1]WCN14828.1 2-dehydropantoate 2-reductase [Marinomonas mediterranea]WCN18860.1 2-dehydropantoate 2-reductase [Marinomonas mediterranea MMB-1]
MKICIAGAGAIGCALAARLAKVHKQLCLLARGDNLIRIKEQGIHLSDLDGEHHVHVRASDDANFLGPQDLILVCTKTMALETILTSIQPMIHSNTVVIPVVNGIPWWYFKGIESRFGGENIRALDPKDQLETLLPHSQIIGSVIFLTASRVGLGNVKANNPHLIVLGEINHEMTDRLEAIRTVFELAGIESRSTDNIRDQLWTKVAANLTSNPLSVVTQSTLEQIYSDPRLTPLVRSILDETMLTAAAFGAKIRFDPPTFMELGAGMGAIKTSMLQDYEAGLPLETDAIGNSVLELASKMDLSMPTTKHIINLAEFMSEQQRSVA